MEIPPKSFMPADAKSIHSVPKPPRATYRLQFNEHFRLVDALALVPYLHELGVSHLYASPLFKARAHSVHGYDVCDFSLLNPEIGTEADLEKLVNALHERKMGLVLDIVPNHMGIGTRENLWWWDVLKNGRASRFAGHFDINWESPDPKLRGKVLIPVLAEDLQRILEKNELSLRVDGSDQLICYHEHEFPVSSGSSRPDLSIKELLERQNYLLADYREGDAKLNYRRFFAVSTLAAIRIESEAVFGDAHSLLREWISRGWIDGLRVDHPDGLRDPEKYLRRLRAGAPDLWIVVEKILQPQEKLPDDWPVQGTVGYDFLNEVNGLFVQSENEKALTDFYSEFTGEPADTGGSVRGMKTTVLQTLFVTEVGRLADLLVRITARYAHQRFSREQLREALTELAASFPVYRTYVRADENFISEDDSSFIKQAVAGAKKSQPEHLPELLDFLGRLLLMHFRGDLENEFIARFQQLTGPVMAKGLEDTAFYCLNRFASLNEVGGDPGKFGVSAREFHKCCGDRQRHWPHSMLASSTHDTKRSEDVRARLNLLSEIPGEWSKAVLRWARSNEHLCKKNFPDRNAQYLFFQTLVGAWPISLERILAYMEKASREAKQHTDWNDRNPEYEDALKSFVTGVFADKNCVRDIGEFVSSLAGAAQVNSLAQTLVKLTAPGVPDIYQGNETWDFSLVDPDNRRPVDFKLRRELLAKTENLSVPEILKYGEEGLPKIWLIQKVLRLRGRREIHFNGNYEPLYARGAKAGHVIAFMRGSGVITIVPRFILQLKNDWMDTALELPRGDWRNEFTGQLFKGVLDMHSLFQGFPVALLARKEND